MLLHGNLNQKEKLSLELWPYRPHKIGERTNFKLVHPLGKEIVRCDLVCIR